MQTEIGRPRASAMAMILVPFPREFDSSGLSFLLDDGEPQLYMEIMLEEQRFGGTIHLIQERNKILRQRVHRRDGGCGIKN